MFTLAGYFLALIMGLTLGLIGAGGSILTVPILVYFFHLPPVIATGYSLLIVGTTALIGAARYYKRKLVNFRAAGIFIVPAMLAVFITRAYIVPAIPETVSMGGIAIDKNALLMLLFALLMFCAALFMLKPYASSADTALPAMNMPRFLKLTGGSASIGLLTGMVGAGGGFLIIPTLIGLFNLPVKEAVGTSLAIIAVNSLVGFNGDIANNIPMDWSLLGSFLLLTAGGMLVGTSFARRINSNYLRQIFGWFVLMVAVCVLADNILLTK